MAILTWVAAGAGNASTDANWSGGAKPVSGDTVIFDNTSDNNCSWDLDAATVGNLTFVIASGYDGTITQAATADMGLASFTQAAGTFHGDASKTITCNGNFAKTGGTLGTNNIKLIMAGETASIAVNATANFYAITFSSNVSISGSSLYCKDIAVGANKTVTLGAALYLSYTNVGCSYSNLGQIIGTGTFYVYLRYEDLALSLGSISAPVIVRVHSSSAASKKLTISNNAALGSTLLIISAHATYTCTVDMAAKTLSATAITVSTRGILTNSGAAAACSCSGAFTVSGASSVVSGNITLTYGTYVQSNGTATQVGNWSGGDVTASGGTLTGAGSASVTLTSSGDVNLTGATVTADKLNLVMTGAGKTLTTTATLFGLKASAAPVNVAASCGITAGAGSHLTTDAGAFLNIASTKTLTLPMYADGATLVPNGIIGGAGTLAITMSDGDISTRLGNIMCPLTIANINTAAANRVLTVLDNPSLAAVTVSSSDDDKTTTLDFAGRSANISGAVTSGTRGNILWGEGVHYISGNIDTSAGASNFETSQIILTKSCTLKTGADQPLYDLLIAPGVTVTLGSDVTVSHIYANGGTLIPGAFALTASGSSYDKVFLPTQLRANISPLISPTGKRFMRRLERVQ